MAYKSRFSDDRNWCRNALDSVAQNVNVPSTMHGCDDSGSNSTSAIKDRLQNAQYHVFAPEDGTAGFASSEICQSSLPARWNSKACVQRRARRLGLRKPPASSRWHASLHIWGSCVEACACSRRLMKAAAQFSCWLLYSYLSKRRAVLGSDWTLRWHISRPAFFLSFVTFVVVLRFILACIIEKASKLHSCFVCLMARSLWVTPSGMIPHQPRFFFFQLTDFISRCIFFMRTFWNEKLLQWKTVIFNRYCTFILPLENRKKTSFWPYWRLRVYSSIINFAQNLYCIRRVLEHWCSITNVDNRHTKLS